MTTKLFLLGGALLLLLASCSNDDIPQPTLVKGESEIINTEFVSLFKSTDKESLKNAILDEEQEETALTRSSLSQDYVSLLDVVQDNDPV